MNITREEKLAMFGSRLAREVPIDESNILTIWQSLLLRYPNIEVPTYKDTGQSFHLEWNLAKIGVFTLCVAHFVVPRYSWYFTEKNGKQSSGQAHSMHDQGLLEVIEKFRI